MTEHCYNCGKEHDTGDQPDFGDVPVKYCPEAFRTTSPFVTARQANLMKRIGYLSVIYIRTPLPEHCGLTEEGQLVWPQLNPDGILARIHDGRWSIKSE